MDKHSIIYLMGFLALGFLSTTYASGAENRSSVSANKLEKATFGGGCFWCMQPPFDKLDGVISTTVGYCGGKEENPTYKQVSAGATGHAEAVQIVYDPSRVSYAELLNVFWMNIDPTQENGQFGDTGAQYRTAIFYHNEEQKRLAEASKKELRNTGKFAKKIVTEIVPATPFYRAEEYHQDYYRKNPVRYKLYRYGSGRDSYLARKWGRK